MKLSLSSIMALVCVLCAACSDPASAPDDREPPAVDAPGAVDVDGGAAGAMPSADAGDGVSPPAADGGIAHDGGSSGAPATRGLVGFCEHYFACGGTGYASVSACVAEGERTWGACRRPQLDAFGTCMLAVSCNDWNPNAYDPNATPCGAEWRGIVNARCT